MASSPILLLFITLSSVDWLALGSAFLMDHDDMTSSDPAEPHFTKCVSREQETFSCWWNVGSYHNLSHPGALRVFYLKKEPSPNRPNEQTVPGEWKECPKYIHSKQECFFDSDHTSIWTPYCMQLRTQDNVTYFNEEDDCFTVEHIVRPDPPVALNWTLLSVSPSGLHYDAIVHWEPPPSADVKAGWMRLEYEVQYRERNGTKWKAMELQGSTQQTIYALHVEEQYEVHIRCKMKAFTKFGDFSQSIFVQVTEIPVKETTFPVSMVLIIGIVAVIIIIVLILFSKQHRLHVILLPLIPVPKIKGIDPELLKKGKLEDLNFILSGGGMGGLPSYTTDFYKDEPWVEFVEVNNEEEEAYTGEKEDSRSSDTQRLLVLRSPEDDSDLPDQETTSLIAALLPVHLGGGGDGSPAALIERPLPTPEERPQTWANTDFYAQVSDVRPSGGVVLSPGQQLRAQESAVVAAGEEESQKKGRESGGDRWSPKAQQQFQLSVFGVPREGYHAFPSEPAESTPLADALPPPRGALPVEYQVPYILPDPSFPILPPVSDYTVVQEVGCQRSLLLNPPTPASPQSCMPHHPFKAMSVMPMGYVTPDILSNLSP